MTSSPTEPASSTCVHTFHTSSHLPHPFTCSLAAGARWIAGERGAAGSPARHPHHRRPRGPHFTGVGWWWHQPFGLSFTSGPFQGHRGCLSKLQTKTCAASDQTEACCTSPASSPKSPNTIHTHPHTIFPTGPAAPVHHARLLHPKLRAHTGVAVRPRAPPSLRSGSPPPALPLSLGSAPRLAGRRSAAATTALVRLRSPQQRFRSRRHRSRVRPVAQPPAVLWQPARQQQRQRNAASALHGHQPGFKRRRRRGGDGRFLGAAPPKVDGGARGPAALAVNRAGAAEDAVHGGRGAARRQRHRLHPGEAGGSR